LARPHPPLSRHCSQGARRSGERHLFPETNCAVRTPVENGAADYLQPSQLGEVITAHLSRKEMSALCQEEKSVRELMWKFGSNART
jgi:hypothetical protein